MIFYLKKLMETKFILKKFNSGMHYIMLEENTVAKLTKNKNKRIICKINNDLEFHCAIIPKKEGGHFINIGLKICKKLKIQEGSMISAEFSVDKTKYQFDMPNELKQVLKDDQKSKKIFEALSAGNQRGLIYLVSQVKSSSKKTERALKIAEKIKEGIISPKIILDSN